MANLPDMLSLKRGKEHMDLAGTLGFEASVHLAAWSMI